MLANDVGKLLVTNRCLDKCFANCCCAFYTRQLEFVNRLVYRVKAALKEARKDFKLHARATGPQHACAGMKNDCACVP